MAVDSKQKKMIAFQTPQLRDIFERIVMAGTIDGSLSESRYIINTVIDSFLPQNTDLRYHLQQHLQGEEGVEQLFASVFEQAGYTYNREEVDLLPVFEYCKRACQPDMRAEKDTEQNLRGMVRWLNKYIKGSNATSELAQEIIQEYEKEPNNIYLPEWWDIMEEIYKKDKRKPAFYWAMVYLCQISYFIPRIEWLKELSDIIKGVSEQIEKNERKANEKK